MQKLTRLFFLGAIVVSSLATPAPAAAGDVQLVFFDNFESDECFPYDPDPRFASIAGAWPEQFSETLETFTAPAGQRGGGIIDASLVSGNSEVRPSLFACVDAACDGGSIAGDNADADGATARVRFQAAPGQQYRFIIKQFGNAPADQYPVAYTLTVDYSDRLDCWEANNQVQQARLISRDQSVFAYMLEGYRDNFLTTDTYQDWYRFDLRQEAFMEFDFPQPAGQHLMRVAVFDSPDGTGSVLVEGQQETAGQPFTAITTRARDPGTYFIAVRLLLSDDGNVGGFGPAPEHWNEEYEMIVRPVVQP